MPKILLSKVAKQRVGRQARAADKELCSRLSGVLAYPPERRVEADQAWRTAFCDWAVHLLDAVAVECLDDSHHDIDDLEAAFVEGPCKWAVQRAYDPKILNAVISKALADAGRSLPADQLLEKLVPFRAMQDAVRQRARHWAEQAADYEQSDDPGSHAADNLPTDRAPAESPIAPKWPWGQLTLTFMSYESVVVKCPDYSGPRTFADLGFANQKNGKPVIAWAMLFALATGDGVVSEKIQEALTWDKVEKAAQDLRRRLKQSFQHQEDPLLTIQRGRSKGSYQARFTVKLKADYELPPRREIHRTRGHGPDK